jgi:histone chaperone ASF1
VFQADQPDPEKIPVADAIGVTAVLLTCSYKEHEFVRVGYFVNNDYIDLELKDNPPPVPQFDKVILFGFITVCFPPLYDHFSLDDTKHS